jgi:hypothetical protein
MLRNAMERNSFMYCADLCWLAGPIDKLGRRCDNAQPHSAGGSGTEGARRQ